MTEAQSSKYTFRLTPKGMLGWGVLTLFMLGWMFVLGILVGRGTVALPRKSKVLSNDLAELKENDLQKEREAIASMAKASSDQNLTYPEALKMAPPKSTVQPRPSATPAKPKATPAPTAATKPKEDFPAQPTPGPQAAKKSEASVAPKPEAPPAPEPLASAKGRFTVQVAAFRDLESANKLVAALRGKGYPAYQLRNENDAKEAWFRVRVGAFDNRPDADGTLKKLQSEKFKAVVVGTP
ncbi:MAG: SPOR domain-containing protein [Desulfobacterales bacterium]|nr:SPOR domain-containing protein [Desulfobacterales bacterium]